MLSETDKLSIIEKHLREVVLPMGIGLKEDGIPELSRRLLWSKNYCFSPGTDRFIDTFATAEAIEQSGHPSATHLFRQSKDDTAPVAEKPVSEARFGGLTKQEFDALPAAKRLEIYTSFETRVALDQETAERAEIATAVRAALPQNFNEFSPETRHALAAPVEAKIVAARKRSQS